MMRLKNMAVLAQVFRRGGGARRWPWGGGGSSDAAGRPSECSQATCTLTPKLAVVRALGQACVPVHTQVGVALG